MSDLKDVTERVSKLIEKAPAGGPFTNATLGPVRIFSEDGLAQSATFPVFIRDGEQYDVTITPH